MATKRLGKEIKAYMCA